MINVMFLLLAKRAFITVIESMNSKIQLSLRSCAEDLLSSAGIVLLTCSLYHLPFLAHYSPGQCLHLSTYLWFKRSKMFSEAPFGTATEEEGKQRRNCQTVSLIIYTIFLRDMGVFNVEAR